MRSASAVRMRVLAVIAIAAAPHVDAGFSSRHLIMGGCSGLPGRDDYLSVVTYSALLRTMPFDTAQCVRNDQEARAAVEAILASAEPVDVAAPILIVAKANQCSWYLTSPGSATFAGECNQQVSSVDVFTGTSPAAFDPFAASLALGVGVVHFWLNEGPEETEWAENRTSLVLTPNSYLGGELVGYEFCEVTAGAAPQRIAVITGEPRRPGKRLEYWDHWLEGFKAIVTAKCPQHEFRLEGYGHMNRADARRVAKRFMVKDSTVFSYVCASDEMALGVIDAANEVRARQTSGLLITGFNNQPDILPYIQSGTVAVTVDPLEGDANKGLVFSVKVRI